MELKEKNKILISEKNSELSQLNLKLSKTQNDLKNSLLENEKDHQNMSDLQSAYEL